jgi:hypothetical protein
MQLRFDTAEEAVAYCQRHGIPYQLFQSAVDAARYLLCRQFRLQPPRSLTTLKRAGLITDY